MKCPELPRKFILPTLISCGAGVKVVGQFTNTILLVVANNVHICTKYCYLLVLSHTGWGVNLLKVIVARNWLTCHYLYKNSWLPIHPPLMWVGSNLLKPYIRYCMKFQDLYRKLMFANPRPSPLRKRLCEALCLGPLWSLTTSGALQRS